MNSLPLNQVLLGDALDILPTLPEKSIDLIFVDPPYNLQLKNSLWRPNLTLVDPVDDDWDRIGDFKDYDDFTRSWLTSCKKLLKNEASIWVIGTYHNIFRIGSIMQDLGYWVLNDIVWIKTNPTPNFHGTRFANAHETMIWACLGEKVKYTFNYQAMKSLNEGLQMRSDWLLPLCKGPERIKVGGHKAHSTQKPESLLYRIILASSSPGAVILDPFFGTGTTGAVAKKLGRNWIGIEEDLDNKVIAENRISSINQNSSDLSLFDVRTPRQLSKRIPIGLLLELGYLIPGQGLYFQKKLEKKALVRVDGKLIFEGMIGSIHSLGRTLMNGNPCNGWAVWYALTDTGEFISIDYFRKQIRMDLTGFEDLD